MSKADSHRQRKQFHTAKDRAPLHPVKRGFFMPRRSEFRRKNQKRKD